MATCTRQLSGTTGESDNVPLDRWALLCGEWCAPRLFTKVRALPSWKLHCPSDDDMLVRDFHVSVFFVYAEEVMPLSVYRQLIWSGSGVGGCPAKMYNNLVRDRLIHRGVLTESAEDRRRQEQEEAEAKEMVA